VNNKTPYQICPLVGVLIYKCSIPLENLHGYVHHLKTSKFTHVGYRRIQLWLFVPFHIDQHLSTPSPCCWMGTFFRFWISINWKFGTRPIVETKRVWPFKKESIWCQYANICIWNTFNYILDEIINLIVYTQLP
jgi:hypothetical protein